MSEPFTTNSIEASAAQLIKNETEGINARIEDENRNGEGEVGTWVDDDE